MTRAGQSSRRARRLSFREQLLYRRPMAVTEIHAFSRCEGAPAYPVCPRCGKTMEREYMAFCSRCGQKLNWKDFQGARVVYVGPARGSPPGAPAPPLPENRALSGGTAPCGDRPLPV